MNLARTLHPTTAETEADPILSLTPPSGEPVVKDQLRLMAAATGESPIRIMQDFARLAAGPGKLAFQDFANLRLFDPSFYGASDRSGFLGRKTNSEFINKINCHSDWHAISGNKIAAGAYLAAHGFTTIAPKAVFIAGMATRGERLFGTKADLLAFLRRPESYPLFGKPVDGDQSLGSIALQSLAFSGATAMTPSGQEIDLAQLADEIAEHFSGGYVFQERVEPAAEIASLTGGALGTVRVLTMLVEGAPQLLGACLKLPVNGNHADNYWRSGNMLCRIDPASGVITNASVGLGLDLVGVDKTAADGGPLGVTISHWRALLDTALEGQQLMAGLPLLGWDIAPSSSGPVVVEMNWTPSVLLNQLADRKGILTPELTALAARQVQLQKAQMKAAKADYTRFVGFRG